MSLVMTKAEKLLDEQIANIKAEREYLIHDTDFDLVKLLVARVDESATLLASQESEIARLTALVTEREQQICNLIGLTEV